jgi:hypothetical protein
MTKHHTYEGVSSRIKNGREVWRYREPGRGGKETVLPGKPGDEAFEDAYRRLKQGDRGPTAYVADLLSKKTFKGAYRLLVRHPDWDQLDPATQHKNSRMIKFFLAHKVCETMDVVWGDVAVADTKAKDIRIMLNKLRTTTPTKSKHVLVAIRKLIAIAVEQDWIDGDMTYGIKAPVPKTSGHKAWPDSVRAQFEDYHDIGEPARTCYALAFWLGNRASDIASLKWSDLTTEEVELPNGTGGDPGRPHPTRPAQVLRHLPRP